MSSPRGAARRVNDGRQELDVRVARERSTAGEQFEQHHAERKHVAACVERLVLTPARATCTRSCRAIDAGPRVPAVTVRVASVASAGRSASFAEPEVGQLRIAVLGNQDVGGLDVAVQNPGSVRRGETVRHAGQQVDDLPPGRASRPWPSRCSVPPSTNSVTRYCRPSSSPASWTVRMCGWLSADAIWASRWKRRRADSSARFEERNLSATGRFKRVSWARNTSPMPPSAIRASNPVRSNLRAGLRIQWR